LEKMNRRCLVILVVVGLLAALPTAGSAAEAKPSPQPEVARRLLAAGREAAGRGAFGEADQALQGALSACRAAGDEKCQWTALASLAAVAQSRGRLDEARSFAEEAASLAHRMRDRAAQGESYHLLALILGEAGDAEAARAAAQRVLAVSKEIERDDLRAMALIVLGRLDLATGKTDEVCRTFEEALGRARQADMAHLRMKAWMGLGRCRLARGELAEADEALEEAFVEAVGLGDKLSVARLTQEMGRLAAARDESSKAEELYSEALSKFRALGTSAYADSVAADSEALRAKAGLPTKAEVAERAAEAKRLGLELLEAGESEPAARNLKEAVALAPYDLEAHQALARAYLELDLQALADKESRYAESLEDDSAPFDQNSENPLYRDYFAALRRQIDRVYVVPNEVLRGKLAGAVRVIFTLERTGRLAEASVETSAGSDLLDNAALTTLRLAEPFPPFPDRVDQERVTITARFVYEQSLAKGPTIPLSSVKESKR
jgi:TonB family protein